MKLLTKIVKLSERYHFLQSAIQDQSLMSDQNKYKSILSELKFLEPIHENFEVYQKTENDLKQCEDIVANETDLELKKMAKEEAILLKENLEKLESQFKILLIPPDPDDDKNIILEIRAGTGGEEASLFCGDLFRMYCQFSEKKKWQIEVMDANKTGLKGYKEISFLIKGKQVFANLKYEMGTHRVQRIPETESNGRIHTSAVTVAVLPEVEDTEITIKDSDLKIDTYRASGAGGQHVNTTDSAVRITHIPTGTVVTCQDEKSQIKNKAKAMKVLKARIYQQTQQQQKQENDQSRKSQVGSGDRSEKIRTYNFTQNRITDHRINLTLYNLTEFLNGSLDEVIKSLKIDENQKKLLNLEDN